MPNIEETLSQLRDRLSKSGSVLRVEVSAFPAIKLLWHQADKVVIQLGNYRSSSSKLSSTLGQVGDAGTLDASANRLVAGLLTLPRLGKASSYPTMTTAFGL